MEDEDAIDDFLTVAPLSNEVRQHFIK